MLFWYLRPSLSTLGSLPSSTMADQDLNFALLNVSMFVDPSEKMFVFVEQGQTQKDKYLKFEPHAK